MDPSEETLFSNVIVFVGQQKKGKDAEYNVENGLQNSKFVVRLARMMQIVLPIKAELTTLTIYDKLLTFFVVMFTYLGPNSQAFTAVFAGVM